LVLSLLSSLVRIAFFYPFSLACSAAELQFSSNTSLNLTPNTYLGYDGQHFPREHYFSQHVRNSHCAVQRGTRVFFWDASGAVKHGVVLGTARLGDVSRSSSDRALGACAHTVYVRARQSQRSRWTGRQCLRTSRTWRYTPRHDAAHNTDLER
jgi:hypothetical protein